MSLQFYADGKDGVFDSTFLNQEPTTIAAGHGGSTAKPSSRESETAAEASIASSAERTEQNLKPQRWISSFVTPNQITSAIAASEKSRLRCSVAVALLDVLLHLGFPLLGSNFTRSVIISRPLYLDLLTNVTPVFAPLLFNNHRGFEGAVEAENKIPSTGGSGTDWTGQAGDALEVAPEGT
ncbi:ATP-dependent phosphofructokinase [Salix suchowensis]|nr:ATP-dependent phosphofructokinase [Salix suchowensis]